MHKKSFHFIGIGGIGMSSLAHLLIDQQFQVTGSDIVTTPITQKLADKGVTIYPFQAKEHVQPGMTVVYSTDIKLSNVEYLAAIDLKCELLHRSQLLAELANGFKAFAIAGTHGKTTTSSLLASVLKDANFDPSFAIGGILPAFETNAYTGKGEYFVFEADESDGTFVNYHPFGAIITNIDNDHLNAFQHNEKFLIEAFQTFANQIVSSSHLFWCGDDQHLQNLNLQGYSYGFSKSCDWKISNTRQEKFHQVFDVDYLGYKFEKIHIPLSGQHNILNAAAVFGLAYYLGVPEHLIRQGFKQFKGVLRRCEHKGVFESITFIDDYAHHPTEIELTLQGIRSAVQQKRLITVFQPHRYSRTEACLGQYGSIFNSADHLIITDIYAAGEAQIPTVSPQIIQQEIQTISNLDCVYIPRSEIANYLISILQKDDYVVTLGAGDVTKVTEETLKKLYHV